MRTAAGDGVEVAAGDERVGSRFAPPRPQIAVAVGRDLQSEALCALDEPVAQLTLGVVEDVPGVPATAAIPADVFDLGEKIEGVEAGHSPSHIGTRRPRERAMSAACS